MGSLFCRNSQPTEVTGDQRLSPHQLRWRLLYGFARHHAPSIVIPRDVARLLMGFFATHRIRFYKHLDWEETFLRESVVTKNVVEFRDRDRDRSVYSQLSASSGAHEWTLTLENVSNSEGLMIGIATTHLAVGHFHDRTWTEGFTSYAFGHCPNGHASVFRNEQPTLQSHTVDESFHWQSGDVITVRLDLEKRTLEFRRNHNVLTVITMIHSQRDATGYTQYAHLSGYRLAIDNRHCGNRIRIVSYK